MADRSGVEDLKWAVEAVRIQQSTGGRLAPILHTLADFMRTRQEVRREVQTLSAERCPAMSSSPFRSSSCAHWS